jgi:hypothetical protein
MKQPLITIEDFGVYKVSQINFSLIGEIESVYVYFTERLLLINKGDYFENIHGNIKGYLNE